MPKPVLGCIILQFRSIVIFMARYPEVKIGNPSKETIRKQELFLKAYAKCGIITKACQLIGIGNDTVRKWRKGDVLFLEQMNEATDRYNDSLEEILNDLIGAMHEARDYKANPTLLIFKMNGAMPQKYKGVNQTSSAAKDVLSEFRKAMRDSKGNKEESVPEAPVEEEVSGIDKAGEIIRGKFGSLNGSSST